MRFKRIEILVNILFWAFMTWFLVHGDSTMDIQGYEVINGKKHKILAPNPNKMTAFLIGQVFYMVYFYIELYLIHRLKKPRAVMKSFVLKSIVLTITVLVLYVYVLVLFVIPNRSQDLNEFGLNFYLIVFYLAVVVCYGFTKKWIQHEYDKQNLEFTKNQAELKLLRQQLQPHFLFNTMNNLLAMVNQSDNPKLAQSIDKLSGLLRYVVYDTKNRNVRIDEEIGFIQNFAELHLLRFEEEEIDFKIDVVGNWNQQKIEPGIFLCYVENAFKHGVQPEEKAYIHIRLDVSEAHKILFQITNSIPQHKVSNPVGGYGLSSNNERLGLAYPNTHQLRIKETEKEYNVQLTIYTHDRNNR